MTAKTSQIPPAFPAFVATKSSGTDGKPSVERGTTTANPEMLGAVTDGDVVIRVDWSSVNFKDALATLPDGNVARLSPLIPGIDLAGVVVESASGQWKAGDAVIAHGADIGTGRHGGYARYCRLAGSTVLSLPSGLTGREAMAIGTAGFTAAQSIHAIQQTGGLNPSDGPVLVTGATGGVGSTALCMLADAGFEVWASTGKASEHDWLQSLGAAGVLERDELAANDGRPLGKERWAAVVDCVGGQTLATAIKTTKYGGSVAASGLTGGTDLPTSVFPFILRGVSLLGIDSVGLDAASRDAIWQRCGTDLKPARLDGLIHEIGLGGLDDALTAIRAGNAKGRYVVKLED